MGTYRRVARFRYALQVALDRARSAERRGECAVADALRALERERSARAELADLTVRARAELDGRGASVGRVYVEIGRRLSVLAAADRERGEREADALKEVAREREDLAALTARRTAIERHRAAARARFDLACDLREAAEFEESNALRRAAAPACSLWT